MEISLPAGEYSGEGWRFDASAEGVTASCQAEVTGGAETALPELKRETVGAVSGRALDVNGAALAGAMVQLLDASGAPAYQTTTDRDGAWLLIDVAPGAYVARVSAPGWLRGARSRCDGHRGSGDHRGGADRRGGEPDSYQRVYRREQQRRARHL